jgi:hypothetical protein
MDDRELLEAAAKAAGLDVRWVAECQDFYEHRPHMLPSYWDKWSPLTDDGDALRLAVRLRMNLNIYQTGAEADCDTLESTMKESGDPYAATRRAIVRAAAAMATGS